MVQTAQFDLIGRTLGDFEIRECLSTGGMGAVYKAYQRGMERIVALKVLPAQLAANAVLLQRFYQEARSAARLDHPNIVHAIAVGEQEGLHYFAMEYVEGETLGQQIRRAGRIGEPQAISIVVAVAEALEAAHDKGMIHRDVKPENVLLTADGGVKLADLGLVKWLDQDLGLTDIGKGLGTTNFMAPEQFKDAKHADQRCDIYALGVTLYTALTGSVPWAGLEPLEMYKRKCAGDLPPVREINPLVSRRTEGVVQRATRVDPAERHASCAEFISDLEVAPRPRGPKPPVEVTRAELALPDKPAEAPSEPGVSNVWFVRYFDNMGQRKQIKLRSEEIRQGFRSGRLAENMRVSRSAHGPWLHLSAFNEFVDLVAQLSRGAKQEEMTSDIERTVAALHAGAPLRRRERDWRRLIWAIAALIVLGGLALGTWLLVR